MRIDKPGVYVTASGQPVQITGIGEHLVSGFSSKTKLHVWDRNTGRLANKAKGAGNRLTIVKHAWK
jgi:hypothetical protein